MKRIVFVAVIAGILALSGACKRQTEGSNKAKESPAQKSNPRILVTLPDYANTPDGCTMTDGGDILLSVPNFNNGALLKAGKIKAEAPSLMVKIDKQNQVTKWYEFAKEDLHPDTGKVGPMGCDIGPDGNLYVADNQLFNDPKNKSRLLRIRIKDGKAVGCDVVAEGFVVSNAVIWRGDTVYVSETILKQPEKGGKLMSGVYAIRIDEWKNGPVKLAPWTPEKADPHLIAVYETSGRIGFGADGLTLDGNGDLYCGIFDDGIIYRTSFDKDGKANPPVVFAKGDPMACCDGIYWCKEDGLIYVADMLRNAVRAVDSKGGIATVHENGDTSGADGGLDQPCEVIVRGRELIVINMDMWFESQWLVNKGIDAPDTISVIVLPTIK
ncbi:MAG TPA: SMP-30/gluconolactonase/LRE family protein [Candidatus Brocadiia bacterium]|nr:SMP-30/gluconolactonase/LRE family protein [Candidatus Brocadiia bacterium]